MKRKVVKTLLTTAVCVSMLGTTCLAATQDLTSTAGQTITGNSTVENPTYKVTVPTGITFAVDPFEQKNQSQIYSEELQLINKSNVPVQVTASVKVEGGASANVTIVDAEDKVTETDTSKKVYIAAEIPSTVTETAAAAAAYTTPLLQDDNATTDVYDASLSSSLGSLTTSDLENMVDTTAVKGTYTTSKKVTLSATDTELVFALAGADYQTYFTAADKSTSASQFKQVASGQNGSTVFRFCGKVNTKATWAANDLTATVKYDLIGLTGTNYNATQYETNAHAYVKPPVTDAAPTFTAATGKITYTTGAGNSGLASITKIEANWGGVFYDVTDQLTDDDNGNLTINAANVDAWGSDPVPVKITYTNTAGSSVTTEEFNVTAR